MTRARLLLGVASVFAGAAVLFVGLGVAFNAVLIAAAVPFGLAAVLLWLHATGWLEARIRRTVDDRAARKRRARPGDPRSQWADPAGDGRDTRRASTGSDGRPASGMDRREALRTLGLSPDADQAAIRRAYRERVKAVHPDAADGDEAAFRRLTAAYDRLRDQ